MSYLFVYGSLLPRQANWYVLAPFIDDEGTPDTVPGELFDTGHGWPAAVFGEFPTRVVGRVFEIKPYAWTILDEFENVPTGEYARVEVTTDSGVVTWAYHAVRSPRLARVASGDWAAHRARSSAE